MHPKTLLQIQNPSRISLNEANCTVFCTPTCQLRCGIDSDPPPPPPPPSPPPSHSHHGTPHLIIGIAIFSILVFVSCVVTVIRWWHCRAGAGRTQPARSNASQRPDIEDDDDDDDPLDGNPVWLIATVGLSECVINRITVVKYKGGEGLVDGTGCSVCLSEFRDGESLRVLPKCDHAFHIVCIDTWLRSHTNCPLCRAAIVLNHGRPSLGSYADQSFGHSRRSELIGSGDSQMTGDVELGDDLVGSSGVDVNYSFSEGRGIDSSGGLSQNKLDSRHLGYREDKLFMVRRCISMDHAWRSRVVPFSQESICISNGMDQGTSISLNGSHPHCPLTQYDTSRMHGFEEGSSFVRSLHVSRVPVNRSSSWSGRVSLSKHG